MPVLLSQTNRYQYQSKFIKSLRWLKWKPLYSLIAIWYILWWLCKGASFYWFPNRGSFLKHIWCCYQSLASMKMQHYYTIDEVFNDCRG